MPVRLSGKDIVKALGKGCWELERVTGSHHVMRHSVPTGGM
jgi:predicted RNA binding protein YcfA (HicA-like mRNA interferase family)